MNGSSDNLYDQGIPQKYDHKVITEMAYRGVTNKSEIKLKKKK